MSTKVIYLSNDVSTYSDSRTVSVPYIAAMYLIAGFSLLLSIVLRTVLVVRLAGFNAMIGVVFSLSLTGLIMAKLERARGTVNRSKFVSFFALIMSAMLIQLAGVVTVLVGEYKIKNGRRASEVFKYIPIVCSAISQVLILSASIVLLTFASTRENKNCPKFALPSKLLVGISGIIAAICAGVRPFLATADSLSMFFVLYYIQITCATLVGLGIVIGVVMAIIQSRRNEPIVAMSQPFFVPAQPVNAHIVDQPSAQAQSV